MLRRVGFLNMRSGPNELDVAFLDPLRGLGYVEGRTIDVDHRWAAGSETRAEALILQAAPMTIDHRAPIVGLAAQHRLPAARDVRPRASCS